jgi:hypothetical protein
VLKVDPRHSGLSDFVEMRNIGYHDDQPFYILESESSHNYPQMYGTSIFEVYLSILLLVGNNDIC